MTTETMRERFARVTTDLLDTDPRLAIVLAEISTESFAKAAATHSDRIVNVGIREELLIGITGGMALTGLRPIAHTYAPFLLERPFEHVKLDLGHQDAGAVLVSVGASYDGSFSGRTHQAPGDVALLDTLGDWTVHVPGHPNEVETLLRDAAAAQGRVYLRLSTRQNGAPQPVRPGRFEVMATGHRGTVLAVGPLLEATLEATMGLDVTVLYAASVRPFDAETLQTTLTQPDVILVEPYLAGTSVPHTSKALIDVRHRILGLGVQNVELRKYGTPDDHTRAHGLDAPGIRAAVTRFLDGDS
jgi:transketolase